MILFLKQNYLSLAILTGTLTACDSKAPTSSTRQPTISIADTKKETGSNDSQGNTSNPPADYQGTEALPPQIVSGAYLNCFQTPQKEIAACQVEDSEARAVEIPEGLPVDWQLINPQGGASENISQNVAPIYSVGYETTFFVPVPSTARGKQLRMKTSDGSISVDLSFEVDALYKQLATLTLQASAIPENGEDEGYFDFIQGFAMGEDEGLLDKEGCGAGSPQGPVVSKTVSLNMSERQEGIAIYMRTICGLQTSLPTVKIEGPAPFKPIVVRLTPGLRDIALARELVLEKGEYKLTFKNDKRLESGSIDAFSFSEVTLAKISR